jgi:tetratricopeptide (TPR) repeat protein
MLSDESIGFEAAGSGFVQEDAKRSKAEVRRFAAPAASPPMPEPMPEAELANEPPAPPAMAKVARNVRADAAGLLKEARDERAAGRLPDALALCRAALAAGPSDNLLADILAEAAQLALAISRHDEAEGYLTRLERLPGGADRAGKIRLK